MGLLKRKASYRMTDSGLTYFSRKTFDVALEKHGVSFPDREWHTVAEMMRVLDGTGYGIAIAIVPMSDVWAIGDGDKELRVVDLRSPSGQEGSDERPDERRDDAEAAGQDDRHVSLDEVAPFF